MFAITQQNVINAAQGLARGQPKFNGTHLTAISIAAHFELVMLQGKNPGVMIRRGFLRAAVYRIEDMVTYCSNGAGVLPLGGTISLWGNSASSPIWLLCTMEKNILDGSSIHMTSICQISSKIGTNGANNIIFFGSYQRRSEETHFIMQYCSKQLILFWVLLAFRQHKHLLWHHHCKPEIQS